jgi:hypothetical protein
MGQEHELLVMEIFTAHGGSGKFPTELNLIIHPGLERAFLRASQVLVTAIQAAIKNLAPGELQAEMPIRDTDKDRQQWAALHGVAQISPGNACPCMSSLIH